MGELIVVAVVPGIVVIVLWPLATLSRPRRSPRDQEQVTDTHVVPTCGRSGRCRAPARGANATASREATTADVDWREPTPAGRVATGGPSAPRLGE